MPEGIVSSAFVNDLGLFFQTFGILGGILFSLVLTCYPKRLMLSQYIIIISMMVTLGFFMYADSQASQPLLCVSISMMGFFLLAEIFVAYELAVEQTAKDGVGDTLSCGIINVTTNVISFCIALSLTPVVSKETIKSNTTSFVVLFICLGIGFIFLVLASI